MASCDDPACPVAPGVRSVRANQERRALRDPFSVSQRTHARCSMHAPLKAKPRRRVEQEEDPASSDDEGLELAGDGAKKPMQILMEDAEALAEPSAAGDEEDAPCTSQRRPKSSPLRQWIS